MAKRSSFTPDSARRVARATKKIERQPVQGLRYRGISHPSDFGRVLRCKLTEAATQGSLATCEIWDGEDQSSFTETGQFIEVYFCLGDADSGDWVYAVETVRGYECLAKSCP